MIADFFADWDLFGASYLCGWLVAASLSLVGVAVVARNQIFLGAAVAQASTCGVALGLFVAESLPEAAHGGDTESFEASMLSASALVAALAAALLTARRRTRDKGGQEALAGWLFLACGSIAVLVLRDDPHGMERVHALLASSILFASPADGVVFAVLLLVVVAAVCCWRDRLLLLLLEPETAAACGLRTGRWELGVAVCLGASIGLALRATGLPYTFGCLVLPTLGARLVCRSPQGVLVAAPVLALACAIIGFVLAHHYEQPHAQVTVALLCAVAAAGGIAWRWRER